MATSLAAQLAQVAANSKSTLNVKAQKAAHSKSLIWEPRVAATQSYQTLYTTCIGGFEELCQLDARFTPFLSTIFSEESQNQDRTQLTAAENEELDRRVEAFLRLAGSRIRLMPAIKSIEWLIRRFRIHEENTQALLLTFLPYHSIPAFATLLSILPTKIPYDFRFLDPYIRSATCPPRSVLVRQAILHPAFLTLISEYTLESCRMQYNYPALISFWAGIMTEAVSGILDKTRSGRANVQSENDQNLLHRLGPIFAESLVMKKVPSIQVASYMAIAVFVAKGHLEDNAVTAFMDQTVYGWTNETVRPALVVLAILAQYRSAKQMSGKTTKALMKVTEIGNLLVEIGQERRVDKLANGLCLALIERLTKKGDARGLATIITILSSSVLKDKQIAVVFKSLILTAHRLNGDNDENGSLRRELGSALIALSQITGKSGETIQSVIDEVKFDIEELEMKLDLSFRSRRLPETIKDDQDMSNGIDEKKAPQDLSLLLKELSGRSESLSPCLVPQPGEVFDEFSHIFFSVVSESSQNTELLSEFEMNPKLRRQAAFKDCTYFSFFIRIWSGPYPALARVAALDMVKRRLKVGDAGKIDLQALLPYCISALGDPSKRVRKAAADLVTVLTALYVPPVPAGGLELWGEKSLYGKAKGFKSLASDIVAKVLHLQLLPTVEECVMDPEHIAAVLRTAIEQGKYQFKPDPALDKKDHLSQPGRLSFLEFLASHIVHSPLMLVKSRLLKIVNEVRGVGTRTRTDFLLEVLEWWASLSEDEAAKLCSSERLETLDMDNRFVDVVVPNDLKGLEFFLEFLRGQEQREKAGLIRAIFARMRKIWSSMKPDVKFTAAEQLLEISQESTVSTDFTSVVSTEAADFLRNVRLTTDILDYFLKSIPTGTKMITEPPSNKRRRPSSSSGGRVVNPVAPELSQELRKVTFILQLVENSDPAEHPDLLDGLFTALSELQHMRTVVGAELGYLQNLVLRSLLAMMPVYKSKKYNKKLEIDSSVGYGDLLVNCIQKSSSPVVQNAALLLVASLATAAPNLVLHSVMPIFTFMGVSVLRQSDDYSAHVVSQTIKEVIPPLIGSMRQGNNNPIIGACDILVSFTAAFEHIPAHRRQGLFVALVETLGPEDFLHAIIGMLVDKYGPSDALLQFIVELLNHFSILTQLKTLVELLDLIADLFKPKPGISSVLLGISDEKNEKDKDLQEIALKQLSAFPSFLANKKLRSQIGGLMETDDMEASGLRDLYAKLLENILILADTVKADKTLHGRCGQALSNHLNLLSIGEFIKAVENLLDRPDMGLRQKVLRALEARVEQESNTDPASRAVLLAFLPQLTAGIRESTDIRYKHTAVTCVDKISEKYGKKDIEAVVAAATTIAGDYCLGQSEQRLRVMALLCLTSLVDVLQDAIVPVLPSAIPQAIEYLGESVEGAVDQELHVASYGFISALAQYLPYMLSTSTYIDRILEVSNKSAELDLDDNTRESRVDCLHFLAKQLEAKEIFSALDRNWESARKAGFSAVAEYLDVLGLAIDKHPKSGISKNAMLLASILTKVFDLRRQEHAKGEFGEQDLLRLSALDASANDKALKMIYKLNDAAFRPVFDQIITWSSSGLKDDRAGRALRQLSVYGFLEAFFGTLKSIVTNYATYILEDAVKILTSVDLKSPEERQLWTRVLQTLGNCFEHDQDDFWQAPAHFSAIGLVLMDQFSHAGTVDVTEDLIPTTVELASAADSQAHQKELNSALLKHLRSESPAIRLAAVKCEQALTDRLGEEWLAMLHEMLPRISELQEDDDEEVERETHRWIVKIEGVLGEDLDDMLR